MMGLSTRTLIFGMVSLLGLLSATASCSSGQSDRSVAQIDESHVLKTSSKSGMRPTTPVPSKSDAATLDKNTDTSEFTDEEIATLFTTCIRDHGFNVPDPELNADGTVKWGGLKDSFDQDPAFDLEKRRGSQALDDCLPLLEGITVTKDESLEDKIQLQDDMLTFAQCLRDGGLDVPDPDFSDGPRASMKPIIDDLKGSGSRVQNIIDSCTEYIFGTRKYEKR